MTKIEDWRSIRAAERVLNLVAQDWIYYEEELSNSVSFPQKRLSMELGYTTFLQRVGFLHKCLMRYEHLKYLCWKNSVIISGLVRAMTMSVEPMKNNLIGDPLEVKQAFMDRVAVYAVVMDIFRSLYEACGVTWFKSRAGGSDKEFEEEGNVWQINSSWDYKLSIFDITRKLLSSVLLCPYLPKTCEIPEVSRCFFHITDPRKFVSARWLNHRDENEHKIIKLLCTAHNASVALLFELLAVLHFLPSEVERNVVAKGIKNIDLERFIRLSVTQIINLLWSSRDTMSAPEAKLLYRQLWILTSLSKQDPIVLEFIRANFAEEFRYYVHPKGIKTRIPDQYTIKPKIIELCEQLRANVEGTLKLKA
ncbi:hypothetical protein Ocin01_06108 [Orchesella cincta]|uniref:Uncharacterized protein n=1 Tax=Orchesella cincta TaxID=48709 RepID=A0A1D2N5P2_ORCCI|nr:hypothetical protein Ocin01_06108 [Orchesella cincta]